MSLLMCFVCFLLLVYKPTDNPASTAVEGTTASDVSSSQAVDMTTIVPSTELGINGISVHTIDRNDDRFFFKLIGLGTAGNN